MMADGKVIGDGSWELHVHVTDLQVERILRVKSDLHIGGVMLRLVEELGELCSLYDVSFTCISIYSLYSLAFISLLLIQLYILFN